MPLFQTVPFPTAPLQTWQAPTLINGWSNYGSTLAPAGYWRDPYGNVYLRGLIVGGTVTQKCFVLPEGYRPAYRMVFVTSSMDTSSGSVHGRCDVDTNGDVLVMLGGTLYFGLDGIVFRVA